MSDNNNIKILLADDDAEDRFIIEDAFNEIGIHNAIQFVEDGEKVLEYLKIDNISLPRLIVLDLNMPRLNGTETLRSLKESEKFKEIPVIIFSTSVNEIEKTSCMNLGALDYLVKPSRYADSIAIAKYFHEFTTPLADSTV
ncbi:MAG: response regulator [Flavipsychrobacter sp.]|nr:response regulator [Flavipsychrobacter sp.]